MSTRLVAGILFLCVVVLGISVWFGATPVGATDDARSCAMVYHVHYPADEDTTQFIGTSGVEEDVYEVNYRLHAISGDTWGSWVTPSETASASVGDDTHGYKYTFSDVNPSTYDMVEWRVVTFEKEGTNLTLDVTMKSADSTQLSLSPITTSTCAIDSDNWQGFFVSYDEE